MAAKLTAVLGNCKRTGRWKIRSHTKTLVVFGNCRIDYRDAYADDELEEIKLDVLCVFGRALFILPPGANVQPSAVSMFSSSKFEVEVTRAESELPSIKLESTTIFGMCRVQSMNDDLLAYGAPHVEERSNEATNLDLQTDTAIRVPPVPDLPPTEIAIGANEV